MNDKELLQYAAKAAGIGLFPHGDPWRDSGAGKGLLLSSGATVWNPLADDGDSRRLQVALRIETYQADDEGMGCYAGYPVQGESLRIRYAIEPSGDDPCAAMRLAVLRAAAEIGRAM